MAIRRQVFNDNPPSFTPDDNGVCTLCGLREHSHEYKGTLLGYRPTVTDRSACCMRPYSYHVESGSTREQRRLALPMSVQGTEDQPLLDHPFVPVPPEAVMDYAAKRVVCREFVVQFEGAVLTNREENGYDDSDWYALVWTGEAIRKVYYATTRGGGTDHNSCTNDATEEVKAAAQGWLVGQYFEWLKTLRADAIRQMAYDAKQPTKGKQVRVVRGRKVAKGTEGEVFWVGEDSYGHERLGIRDAAGEVHWTAASNVDVIDPEDYILPFDAFATDEALMAYAETQRGNIPWYFGTAVPAGFFRVNDSTRFIIMAADAA